MILLPVSESWYKRSDASSHNCACKNKSRPLICTTSNILDMQTSAHLKSNKQKGAWCMMILCDVTNAQAGLMSDVTIMF